MEIPSSQSGVIFLLLRRGKARDQISKADLGKFPSPPHANVKCYRLYQELIPRLYTIGRGYSHCPLHEW